MQEIYILVLFNCGVIIGTLLKAKELNFKTGFYLFFLQLFTLGIFHTTPAKGIICYEPGSRTTGSSKSFANALLRIICFLNVLTSKIRFRVLTYFSSDLRRTALNYFVGIWNEENRRVTWWRTSRWFQIEMAFAETTADWPLLRVTPTNLWPSPDHFLKCSTRDLKICAGFGNNFKG